MDLVCMMCGKQAPIKEGEPDRYCEYGKTPDEYTVIWVYCESCDVWTQHGLKN